MPELDTAMKKSFPHARQMCYFWSDSRKQVPENQLALKCFVHVFKLL